MVKTKSNEILKVTIAVALAIGLFSAAFIGINGAMFAAATNKTENLPPVAVVASNTEHQLPPVTGKINIPAEGVPLEDYQTPKLTVFVLESPSESFAVSANALSPEEAAERGALYIWEMFGESIDGKTVEMFYTALPSSTKAYWHGAVADSKADLDRTDMKNGYNPIYDFCICAVSGERIDISNLGRMDEIFASDWDSRRNVYNALRELTHEENVRIDEMKNSSDLQSPELVEECTKAAAYFAAIHFQSSEVASVKFVKESSSAYALDENGNVIIVPSKLLQFIVTDSTGREAKMSITTETKELSHIITQYNDIVPGYNYESNGLG